MSVYLYDMKDLRIGWHLLLYGLVSYNLNNACLPCFECLCLFLNVHKTINTLYWKKVNKLYFKLSLYYTFIWLWFYSFTCMFRKLCLWFKDILFTLLCICLPSDQNSKVTLHTAAQLVRFYNPHHPQHNTKHLLEIIYSFQSGTNMYQQ